MRVAPPPSTDPSGIYVIEDADGRQYVGSSRTIKNRWYAHRLQLDKGIHHNRKLQGAWKKRGGSSAFTFRVVEYVEKAAEMLELREQAWIDKLKPYYNIALSAKNHGISDEAKDEIALRALDRDIKADEIKLYREAMRDVTIAGLLLRAIVESARPCNGDEKTDAVLVTSKRFMESCQDDPVEAAKSEIVRRYVEAFAAFREKLAELNAQEAA